MEYFECCGMNGMHLVIAEYWLGDEWVPKVAIVGLPDAQGLTFATSATARGFVGVVLRCRHGFEFSVARMASPFGS